MTDIVQNRRMKQNGVESKCENTGGASTAPSVLMCELGLFAFFFAS